MEQELTLAIAPLIPILGGIAASAAGGALAGRGDKKAAEAAQAEALALERQRQTTLEGRFAAQQPLREKSLQMLLGMGSKENPFSRRMADTEQAGILSAIQSLQAQSGQKTSQQNIEQTLQSILNDPKEIEKFKRSVALGGRERAGDGLGGMVGGMMQREGIREAGDVLRHFGFDIDAGQVKQLIDSGQAGELFTSGGMEILQNLGVTLPGSASNAPVF